MAVQLFDPSLCSSAARNYVTIEHSPAIALSPRLFRTTSVIATPNYSVSLHNLIVAIVTGNNSFSNVSFTISESTHSAP